MSAVQIPDFLEKSGISLSLGSNRRKLKQCGAVFVRDSLLRPTFGHSWVWMVSETLPGYCDVDLSAEASVGLS